MHGNPCFGGSLHLFEFEGFTTVCVQGVDGELVAPHLHLLNGRGNRIMRSLRGFEFLLGAVVLLNPCLRCGEARGIVGVNG